MTAYEIYESTARRLAVSDAAARRTLSDTEQALAAHAAQSTFRRAATGVLALVGLARTRRSLHARLTERLEASRRELDSLGEQRRTLEREYAAGTLPNDNRVFVLKRSAAELSSGMSREAIVQNLPLEARRRLARAVLGQNA
jgi:hypothetical protein